MNLQDRAVVKALLQSMTNSCLFHTDEFRAALKHFNITTTYIDQQVSDEAAVLLGKENNHFVDVFRPRTIDTHTLGERYWFATKAEAEDFATSEGMSCDQSIEAAHAEALLMDAEFNFELVSRVINISDLPCMDEDRAQWLKNRWSMFWGATDVATRVSMVEAAHVEALAMNQSSRETVRAIIAQAIHAGANSFGHVTGEHEELVETLRNAGFARAASAVDQVMDEIEDQTMGDGTATHKVIRSRWLEALRRVSATI